MEETPVALQGLKLVRHISTFQEIAVIGRDSEYKDDYNKTDKYNMWIQIK